MIKIRKVFLHVKDYPDAPELVVLGDGSIQIDGKEVSKPTDIVKALADNAMAWSKCVDEAGVINRPKDGVESVAIGDAEATYVHTYHGIAIRGPWPATAEGG